jgi:hypothetical protein
MLFYWASTTPLSLSHSADDASFHLGIEISLKLDSKHITAVQVMQGQQPCGLLFERVYSCDADCTALDVVLLSENETIKFRENSFDFWSSLNIDSSVFPVEDWCTLNILLVRWNGDAAERVAVGVLHREAWMKAATERKVIKCI